MADRTERFGFTTFDSKSDSLAQDGYKAFGTDREALDRLLTYAVEKHTHDGRVINLAPTPAPNVTYFNEGGALPANRNVYYRTSIVDRFGQEHVASLVATVYTAPQLSPPDGAPIVTPTSGTLLPGDYLYAASVHSGVATHETPVSRVGRGTLTQIGGFGVQLPRPPSGARGWNIYRKGPTDRDLMYLTSFAPDDDGLLPDTFEDVGGWDADRVRSQPTTNTTSAAGTVVVYSSTPLAEGETMKVYRTYDLADWENSLLVWTASDAHVDRGEATKAGFPPATSTGVGGAPKIDLTEETEGALPTGLVNPAALVHFAFIGPVEAGVSPWQWVCEYDDAVILSMRASLGRGSSPAAQPVVVALDHRHHDELTWERYRAYANDELIVSVVPVGESVGTVATFSTFDYPQPKLSPGEALRPVILESGSGATPTDHDLSVVITMAVRHGSSTQTHLWEIS